MTFIHNSAVVLFLIILAIHSVQAKPTDAGNSTSVDEHKNNTLAQTITGTCLVESKSCKAFKNCCDKKCPEDHGFRGFSCADDDKVVSSDSYCTCDIHTPTSFWAFILIIGIVCFFFCLVAIVVGACIVMRRRRETKA